MHNLAAIETGAAQRNLSNLAASPWARIFGMKNVLDFGGGDGLLCSAAARLSHQLLCNRDKYAQANYARAFVTPDFARPQIVLAFEVLDHSGDRNSDLPELFRFEPEILICSTGVFSGQGADWRYLPPRAASTDLCTATSASDHCKPIRLHAADLFGVRSVFSPFPAYDFEMRDRRILLEKHMLRLFSAAMRLIPASGVSDDFNSSRSRK